MINNVVNKTYASPPAWNLSQGGRFNISDKITQTPVITPVVALGVTYYFMTFPYLLYKLESQFTKKTKIFSRGSSAPACGININCFDRWVVASWLVNTPGEAVEDLTIGRVIVGSEEFPLGFYNLTIYEMETSDDLNPDNAKATLYTDILNMYPNSIPSISANFEEVQYNEYTTNDSENESVYLTN